MWWWWSSIQLKLEHNNFASARTRDSVKEFRFAINKCNNQSNVILRCARFHLYRTKTPISHFAWNSSRTKCIARIYRDNKHDNPLFHIAVKRHNISHTHTNNSFVVGFFVCVRLHTFIYGFGFSGCTNNDASTLCVHKTRQVLLQQHAGRAEP